MMSDVLGHATTLHMSITRIRYVMRHLGFFTREHENTFYL